MPDARRPPLPLWAAVPVAALAGAALDTAFPELAWWAAAFPAVALALIALIGRRAGSSLLVGFVFGTVFFLLNVDFTARWVGPLPWIALAVLQALFVALGALLITWAYRWIPRAFRSRGAQLIAVPAVVAGLWVLREEIAGSFPYGGFPWGRIGTSQVNGPLAEAVSWVGTAGLSFLVVFAVAVLVESVRRWSGGDGIRPVGAHVLPVLALLAAAALVPVFPTSAAGVLTVASVQGNGPAGYFDQRSSGDVLESQYEATRPLFGQSGIDLVLWPEGAVDLDPLSSPFAASAMESVTARTGAPLLANGVVEDAEGRFFNTSFLWRQGEGAVARYDKRHPVPFGEYVPDRDFYASIAPDLIDMIGRDYTPGTLPPVFDLGGTVAGLAICFDVIYDDVIRDGALGGAEVFLFQTNNADFRGTDENLQQLAVARLRAIETGRAVVNLSTVGTSQVIGPSGATIDSLPANEPGHMLTDVPLRTGLTPAVVVGGALSTTLTLGAFATLLLAGVLQRMRRRNTKTPAPQGTGVTG